MKTHSITWPQAKSSDRNSLSIRISGLNTALSAAAKSFLALVPALAIVTGAAWLVSGADLAIYLQAALWTSGFVFFGLAIESEKPAAIPAVASGFALPALAWLSSSVAIEFAIVGAAVVAAWIAAAIFRH